MRATARVCEDPELQHTNLEPFRESGLFLLLIADPTTIANVARSSIQEHGAEEATRGEVRSWNKVYNVAEAL